MKAPDKIYLQACGDCPGVDSCQSCKFDDLGEVTWSEEKVWEKDIPYIRKDKITEILQKQIDELVECHSFELSYELREVLDNINEI